MIMKLDLNQANLLEGRMKNLALHQLPSAYKKALNQTARDVNDAEVAEMKRVFDRPTPYTLRATYVWYGREYNEIRVREWAGKGTPAVEYLRPEVYGEDRNTKRFERALQYKGILRRGMYAVPGPNAELDSYGNVSRGQIVKILAYFNAFDENNSHSGHWSNMTDEQREKMARGTKKSIAGITYFAVRGYKKSNLHPGIYAKYTFQKLGTAIKCLFLFVKKPKYKKLFDFEKVGERVFYDRFPENLWLFSGDAIGGK